jgi:hypothetical protein
VRALYVHDPSAVELTDTVYALDATTIDLCLSVFPWAHYSTRHGAVKLHTLLDLRGQIPTVVHIEPGKRSEQSLLWHQCQWREDPNLDRNLRVCPGRHRQEAAKSPFLLPFSTRPPRMTPPLPLTSYNCSTYNRTAVLSE